jgi:hypothetical protein
LDLQLKTTNSRASGRNVFFMNKQSFLYENKLYRIIGRS